MFYSTLSSLQSVGRLLRGKRRIFQFFSLVHTHGNNIFQWHLHCSYLFAVLDYGSYTLVQLLTIKGIFTFFINENRPATHTKTEKESGGGAKSHDGEKAWSSIDHAILSGPCVLFSPPPPPNLCKDLTTGRLLAAHREMKHSNSPLSFIYTYIAFSSLRNSTAFTLSWSIKKKEKILLRGKYWFSTMLRIRIRRICNKISLLDPNPLPFYQSIKDISEKSSLLRRSGTV